MPSKLRSEHGSLLRFIRATVLACRPQNVINRHDAGLIDESLHPPLRHSVMRLRRASDLELAVLEPDPGVPSDLLALRRPHAHVLHQAVAEAREPLEHISPELRQIVLRVVHTAGTDGNISLTFSALTEAVVQAFG